MNNARWTWFAIAYECGFAYAAALIIYQIGGLFSGEVGFNVFTVLAIAVLAYAVYMLFRPYKESVKLDAVNA
jgi:ferrous iron transport protein B